MAYRHRKVNGPATYRDLRELTEAVQSGFTHVERRVTQVGAKISAIRKVVDTHTEMLEQHTETLNQHTDILNQHTDILDGHSQILRRLDQERIFTVEMVKRIEREVEHHKREIQAIKKQLHLASR